MAAEAVVLAGLFTLVLRLHNRMNKVRTVSTGAVEQMAALVREAETLSVSLAEQLEEQAHMQEELLAEQTRLRTEQAPQAPVRATTARTAAVEIEQPATAARKRASKAAVTAADEPAPARPRARKSAAPTETNDLAADIAAARKRGMDPLGIAIQRGLGKQAAPLA